MTTSGEVVEETVKRALRPFLSSAKVLNVEINPAADDADHEVLRIMVVLDRLPGEPGRWRALDAIGAVQQALLESGEVRFPVMDFVTEEELKDSTNVEP
ncbi:MAG: hypothetical protein N2Z67_05835 [Acetobacteraceae bacterium]|nr:hypothetical protein [Acetobacteraceae bacterium]